MKFYFDNVGILSNVTIDCNGLSVITGFNNSGKTTLGKAIYALFDAVEDLEVKNLNDKQSYANKAIHQVLNMSELRYMYYTLRAELEIAQEQNTLEHNVDDKETILDYLNKDMPRCNNIEAIINYIDKIRDLLIDFDIDKILKTFTKRNSGINTAAYEKFKSNLQKALDELDEIKKTVLSDLEMINYSNDWIGLTLINEFSGQIQPVKNKEVESTLSISDNGHIFDIKCVDNSFDISYKSFNNTINRIFMLDDIYDIDDAYCIRMKRNTTRFSISHNSDNELPSGYLDLLNSRTAISHSDKNRLWIMRKNYLSIIDREAIYSKYKEALDLIDKVIPGDFLPKQIGMFYRFDGTELNIKNLASGSKVFAIIKILLMSGALNEKTLLILDEPEVHLHPEWQNKYAELLVILIKTIKCKVILSTHSPNFLLAIETMVKKYGIEDMFNTYVTKRKQDNYMVEFNEVSDNIEQAYELLAKPYLQMDAIRYELNDTSED